MYALVEYKGKQYKAEKGATIRVDKIDAEAGSTIEVDTVLLISDEGRVNVGAPYVAGAKVTLVVEEAIRDKKIIVYKYKSKKDYHRTIGHRQPYTKVRVQDIASA